MSGAPSSTPSGTRHSGQPEERPAFAHASEAELARILDFYGVRWEYEPHTFPILWNLDGAVVESFTPDFWLPDLDVYVELTTLRQKLVRKKNRKLRRLRELYPDLRIKLFYARDFRELMLKYGKLALAEALTGASGQVVPDRGEDLVAAGVDDPPVRHMTPPTGRTTPPVARPTPPADPPAPPARVAVAVGDPVPAAEPAPVGPRTGRSRRGAREAGS